MLLKAICARRDIVTGQFQRYFGYVMKARRMFTGDRNVMNTQHTMRQE
jgi:succinate dehydrogenase/fumarate reductase flavoprotein subunit